MINYYDDYHIHYDYSFIGDYDYYL